jgi:RNA polymerase sigma-70 factor (ECF subfamily)
MDDESLDNKDMLESTDSFEAAYKSHAQSIYKFLFWRTKDTHLSEDLTSSTFEKAWISRKSFHGGSVQAWLYRIARNVLIDHWRKNKTLIVDKVDNLEDVRPSTGEMLDKDLQLQLMKKAVNKLPKDMRSVVRLRFIEGMSCKHVAVELDLSDANVRVIQYRALKKLKEYLQ